jgi:hypothetical protein
MWNYGWERGVLGIPKMEPEPQEGRRDLQEASGRARMGARKKWGQPPGLACWGLVGHLHGDTNW